MAIMHWRRWAKRVGSPTPEDDAFDQMLGRALDCCSFCGEARSAAYWTVAGIEGASAIGVCRECAVEVLPALMADALVGEGASNRTLINDLKAALDRADARFWKAASSALAAELRDATR
jgi:hypothetical protein